MESQKNTTCQIQYEKRKLCLNFHFKFVISDSRNPRIHVVNYIKWLLHSTPSHWICHYEFLEFNKCGSMFVMSDPKIARIPRKSFMKFVYKERSLLERFDIECYKFWFSHLKMYCESYSCEMKERQPHATAKMPYVQCNIRFRYLQCISRIGKPFSCRGSVDLVKGSGSESKQTIYRRRERVNAPCNPILVTS